MSVQEDLLIVGKGKPDTSVQMTPTCLNSMTHIFCRICDEELQINTENLKFFLRNPFLCKAHSSLFKKSKTIQ